MQENHDVIERVMGHAFEFFSSLEEEGYSESEALVGVTLALREMLVSADNAEELMDYIMHILDGEGDLDEDGVSG